jgi:hypothetical protein
MCEKEQGICMCVTRGGRGGIRQINTATKYFYWLIKKKKHLGFEIFIDIWFID